MAPAVTASYQDLVNFYMVKVLPNTDLSIPEPFVGDADLNQSFSGCTSRSAQGCISRRNHQSMSSNRMVRPMR